MAQILTTPIINSYPASSRMLSKVYSFNLYAILSSVSVVMFLAYFILPHRGILYTIFSPSIFYIVVLPVLTTLISLIALHQIKIKNQRGRVLSLIALGVTALYCIVALAVPVVLLGLYLLYTFVL